jgi:AraC-like DNA-binding protein
LLNIVDTSKLRGYGRRLRDALLPGGLILSYHRVADAAFDPWGVAVSPGHFEEHLALIRRFGQPVRLSQLTDRLKEGKSVADAAYAAGLSDAAHFTRTFRRMIGATPRQVLQRGFAARDFHLKG